MQLERRVIAGGLCVLTAVITGYRALRFMYVPGNEGPQPSWPAIMLGASILLLGAGIHAVVPPVRGAWLVLFTAAFPVALWAVLFRALPLRCWFFALAVALSMWITQALASALKKAELVVLITSLILAASWVPVSVNTLRGYFSPTLRSSARVVVFPLLALWVLILESVVVGILLGKSAGSGER